MLGVIREQVEFTEVALVIVPKDFPPLDSSNDDVVKHTRSIDSIFSWHTKYKHLANYILQGVRI